MILREASWPKYTTPYQTDYVQTVTTGTTARSIQKNAYYVGDNAIMDAEGEWYFVTVKKKVYEDSAWKLWDAKNGGSLVVEFYEDGTKAPFRTVTIDSSNCREDQLPTVLLKPETEYFAIEKRVPNDTDFTGAQNQGKNNSLARGDYITYFRTGTAEESMTKKPYAVEFYNTPYVELTLTKKNGSDATTPYSGAKLYISQSDSSTYDNASVKGSNGSNLADSYIKGTTADDGTVTFKVPIYDYRNGIPSLGEGTSLYETFSTYYISEEASDKLVAEYFKYINDDELTVKMEELKDSYKNELERTLYNPTTGDIELSKYVMDSTETGTALKGVNFDLYFCKFSTPGEFTQTRTTKNAKVNDANYTSFIGTFTTGADGTVKLENLYSGYYKLVETIPAGVSGYVEGKTNTVTKYFAYETPGDKAALTALGKSSWAKNIVVADAQTDPDTLTEGDGTLTMKDSSLAAVTVTKTLTAAEDGARTITIQLYKGTAMIEEQTMNIAAGSTTGSVVFENLEPGTDYTVKEVVDAADHYAASSGITNLYKGIYSSEKDADKADKWMEPATGVTYTTDQFTVSRTNSKTVANDNSVKVNITNTPADFSFNAIKVDDSEPTAKVLQGAEFVVYYTVGTTEYYYTGKTDDYGMGIWDTDRTKAAVYTTDAEGKLAFTAYGNKTLMGTAGAAWTWNSTANVTIDEVKAPYDNVALVTINRQIPWGTTLTEEQSIVDYSGAAIYFNVYGRTYQNAVKKGTEGKELGNVTVELYKVEADGTRKLIATTTTATDGSGSFINQEALKPGEHYVLVEQQPGGDTNSEYLPVAKKTGVDQYYLEGHTVDLDSGSASGSDLSSQEGLTGSKIVLSYDDLEDKKDQKVKVNLYNEPYAKLLVLKYDYEDPANRIPISATFLAETTDENDSTQYSFGVNTDTPLTDAQEEIFSSIEGYTYCTTAYTDPLNHTHNFYYTKDNAKYSFNANIQILPGTYTVTETKAGSAYFLVNGATGSEAWTTVKDNVEMGTDGEAAVLVFANIPNPTLNGFEMSKSGQTEKLGYLLDTDEEGNWQTVTYTISDFAPGKTEDEEEKIDKYQYPLKEMTVTDDGLTFTHVFADGSSQDVKSVEAYVKAVTVGAASSDEGAAYAYVSGRNSDGGWVILGKGSVASAMTVELTPGQRKTYDTFKVEYYKNSAKESLPAGFHADSITATWEVKQKGDKTYYAANLITNSVAAKVTYDIGTDESCTFNMRASATVEAEGEKPLPTGDIEKKVRCFPNGADEGFDRPVDGSDQCTINPGEKLVYSVTFTNTDAFNTQKSITSPFVADILPDVLDYVSAEYTTTSSTVSGECVYESDNRLVYFDPSAGSELKPGETVTLKITVTVDVAKSMENMAALPINNGFAGSMDTVDATADNPNGTSFATVDAEGKQGNPAYQVKADDIDVPTTFKGLYGVHAQLQHRMDQVSSLTINKMVSAEATGLSNYKSGNNDIAVAYPEGQINYKIIVTYGTDSTTPFNVGEMRVMDILPDTGDKESGNPKQNRNSDWKATFDSNVSATIKKPDGTTENVQVKTYTSGNASPSLESIGCAQEDGTFSAIDTGVWNNSGSASVLFQINSIVEPGSVVTINFQCTAPKATNDDGTSNFYGVANNDSVVTTKTWTKPNTPSNRCRVTMTPMPTASIGDNVWVDKNANGIQDEGEELLTGVKKITLKMYRNNTTSVFNTKTCDFSDGTYGFSNLQTALLQSLSLQSSAYDDNGNIIIGKLNGSTPYAYRLFVSKSDVPTGYFLTSPYAGNNGKTTTYQVEQKEVTDTYDQKTVKFETLVFSGSDNGYETDSNFRASGDDYVSSIFYLPMRTDSNSELVDASYPDLDIGFIRGRDLVINKTDSKGRVLAGAEFSIYGPYDDKTTNIDLSGATPIAKITTGKDGQAVFNSSDDLVLNYYSNYVIVETAAPAGMGLDGKSFTYSGDALYTREGYTLTGEGIINAGNDNWVVLKAGNADKGDDIDTHTMNVVDVYNSTGSVKIKAEKTIDSTAINDKSLAGKFGFKLTTTNDKYNFEDGDKIAYIDANGVADFGELTYDNTIFDGQKTTETFQYYMQEIIPEDTKKLPFNYDTKKISFTVTVTDDLSGKLKVVAKDADGNVITQGDDGYLDISKFVFDNTSRKGDMTLKKLVNTGNGNDLFDITVIFAAGNEASRQFLFGKSFEVTDYDEKTVTIPDDGKVTFSLKKDQEITIKGLPTGTTYTVSEADYSALGYKAGVVAYTTWEGGVEKTIGEGADQISGATVTNDRSEGSLTLSKFITGAPGETLAPEELAKSYEFTLTLTYADTIKLKDDAGKNTSAYPTIEYKNITKKSETCEGNVITIVCNMTNESVVTVSHILEGTTYKVTETNEDPAYDVYIRKNGSAAEDYQKSETRVVTGTITDGVNDKLDATVDYDNRHSTGNLKISKKVLGTDALKGSGKTFTMNITLSGSAMTGDSASYPCYYNGSEEAAGNVTFTKQADGTYTGSVTITDSDAKTDASVIIKNIQHGTAYTIAEERSTGDVLAFGYVTTYEGDTGSITAGELSECTVKNTRDTGSLEVTKVVNGSNTDNTKEFVVTVTITLPEGTDGTQTDNKPVLTEKSKGITSASYDADNRTWTYEMKLAHNEFNCFENILYGSAYTITEDDYFADGYTTVISNNGLHEISAEHNKNEETVTNTHGAGLTLEKIVVGSDGSALNTTSDSDREFKFNVTLTETAASEGELYGKTGLTYTVGTEKRSVPKMTAENHVFEVILKAGEKASFIDLPVNIEYSIEEVTGSLKDQGYNKCELTNASGTISADTAVEATAKNYRAEGAYTLTKKLEGDVADAGEMEFEFALTWARTTGDNVNKDLNDEAYIAQQLSGVITNAEGAQVGDAIKLTFNADGTISPKITLTGAQTLTVTNILAGCDIKASEATTTTTVTGATAAYDEGFTVSGDNEIAKTVTEGKTASAQITNTRNTYTLDLSKVISGAAHADDDYFEFEIEMTADTTDHQAYVNQKTYAVSGTEYQTTLTKDADRDNVWHLKTKVTATVPVEISGILHGTTIKITETNVEQLKKWGYTAAAISINGGTATAGYTATLTNMVKNGTAVVTNTRAAGKLNVTKVTAGNAAETDKEFTFTVKLDASETDAVLDSAYPTKLNGKDDGTLTFTVEEDGRTASTTFTLKSGDTRTITNIPVGVEYTVTEDPYQTEGYTTTSVGETGEINAKSKGSTCTYTNTRNLYSLELKKLIDDAAHADTDTFRFQITMYADSTEHQAYVNAMDYSVTIGDKETKLTKVSSGTTFGIWSLEMKANETAKISGILSDTNVVISEMSTDQLKKWGYTSAKISVNGAEPSEGYTAYLNRMTGDATVAVTNIRKAGELNVTKITEGNGRDTNKDFTFTVVLDAGAKDAILEASYPTVKNGSEIGSLDFKLDEDSKLGTATFTLKSDETLTIKNVPVGVHYTVTEDSYLADGYTTVKTGDTGYFSTTEKTAVFTNTRKVGNLNIAKTVEGQGGETNQKFTFKVELVENPELPGSIYGRPNTSFAYSIGNTTYSVPTAGMTKGNSSFTFELTDGQTAKIVGLPTGTTYTVTEVGPITEAGYHVTMNGKPVNTVNDEIGDDTTIAVEAVNTRSEGSYELNKILVGEDDGKTFEFTLTMTIAKDGTANADVADEAFYTQKPIATVTNANDGATSKTEKIVFNGDHTFTVYLKKDQTFKMNNLLEGTVITAVETKLGTAGAYDRGYVVTGDDSDISAEAGKKVAAGSTVSATITNTLNIGDIAIEKKIESRAHSTDDTFTFNIEMTAAAPVTQTFINNRTYKVSVNGGTESDLKVLETGIWTITLKENDIATITGIPVGTTVTVTEIEVDQLQRWGYTGIKESEESYTESAVVTEDTEAHTFSAGKLTFTNLREAGDLEVYKISDGNAFDYTKDFTFNVTLTGAGESIPDAVYATELYKVAADGKQTLSKTGTLNFTVDGSVATATFTLKGDEMLKILNITKDTSYDVAETDYTAEGYYTTKTGVAGDIVNTEGGNKAEFTNTRDQGHLAISKTETGTATGTVEDFEFTVTLEQDAIRKLPVNLTYKTKLTKKDGTTVDGELTFTGTADKATATFTIKADEKLVIYGIYTTTKYTVAETDYTTDGYTTYVDGRNTLADGNDGRVATGVIESGESYEEVTSTEDYTNERNSGSLTIKKVVKGISGDPEQTFNFTVDLTEDPDHPGSLYRKEDGSYKYTVTYKDGTEKTLNLPTSEWTEDSHSLVVVLKNGEKAVFSDLLYGTAYVVSEDDYLADGYHTELTGESGTIGADNAEAKMQADNIRYEGSYELKKTVEGNDPTIDKSTDFEFTLTMTIDKADTENAEVADDTFYAQLLTGKKSDGTTQKLDFSGADHSVVVTLKAGQTMTVEGLLVGTVLTAAETWNNDAKTGACDLGYTVTGDDEVQKAIVRDDTVKAEIINTRNVTTMEIAKVVETRVHDEKDVFEFELTFTADDECRQGYVDGLAFQVEGASQQTEIAKGSGARTLKLYYNETAKISGIPDGTTVKVEEVNKAQLKKWGYTMVKVNGEEAADYTGEQTVTVAEPGSLTFTNMREAGDLSIHKIAQGNAFDYDKDFTFTVTLTNTDESVPNETYKTELYEDGTEEPIKTGTLNFTVDEENHTATATFTLKGDQTLKILNITKGTVYDVTEEDYRSEGYYTTFENESGKIATEGNTATYTNDHGLANLEISKTLSGNATGVVKNFNFTVKLSNPCGLPVAGTYKTETLNTKGEVLSEGEITFTENEDGSATASFKLAGGRKLRIRDINTYTEYVVKESSYSEQGYTTSSTGATGTLMEDETGVATALAAYTNTRNSGALTITKTVVATGMKIPTDREWSFTVNLTRPDGLPYTGTMTTSKGTLTFVNGTASFKLRHGESLTINDILVKSTYTVSEKTYTGVVTTFTGETGTMTTVGATAAFTNNVDQVYRDLTARKVWIDNNNYYNKRAKYVRVTIANQFETIGTYTLNDANDWTVKLEQLPRYTEDGTTIVYSVTEVTVPDGYKTPRYRTGSDGAYEAVNKLGDPYFPPEDIIIEDLEIPLGADLNMNEGYCFD